MFNYLFIFLLTKQIKCIRSLTGIVRLGNFRLDRIHAVHLLVFVQLGTPLDDTFDPIDVVGQLGVEARNPLATAHTSRHHTYQGSNVVIITVSVSNSQGPPAISLTGSTESSLKYVLFSEIFLPSRPSHLLVLYSLGTEKLIVQPIGNTAL